VDAAYNVHKKTNTQRSENLFINKRTGLHYSLILSLLCPFYNLNKQHTLDPQGP